MIITILSLILLGPYWLVLNLRHRRYHSGKKSRASFPMPVVSVGNITVGGTGKTPMAEYLIELLSADHRVAVLSRGYRRRTRGFRMVETTSTAEAAGDEPLQIKRKYPQTLVAVDANRKRGIETLLTLPNPPQAMILDDGFQQLDVRPSHNLLLISYERPINRDRLLPFGRLRDLPKRVADADAVIFTKCPDWLDEADRERLRTENKIAPEQPVFFTRMDYGEPKAVFEGVGNNRYIYAKEVILFTGIANPKPLVASLTDRYEQIWQKHFPDHHYFTRGDLRVLWRAARMHPLSVLMTTEKDAQRLLHNRYVPDAMKERLFYLPVRTAFLTVKEEQAFGEFLSKNQFM